MSNMDMRDRMIEAIEGGVAESEAYDHVREQMLAAAERARDIRRLGDDEVEYLRREAKIEREEGRMMAPYQPDRQPYGTMERLGERLDPERRLRLYRNIARRLRAYPDAYGVRRAAIEVALQARKELQT